MTRVIAPVVVCLLGATACSASDVAVSARPPSAAPADQAIATPSPADASDPTPTVAASPDADELSPEPAAPTATPEPAAAPTPPPLGPLDEAGLAAAFAVSRLDEAACPAPAAAAGVTCFVAVLPVRADRPDPDNVVELMVALVDNGDPEGVGPVAFLQGGPGVGSIANAPNFSGAQHDLLFVDQRGTGYSTPKLDCPEVDALWVTEHTDVEADRTADDDAVLFGAYEQCRDRLLAAGVDFDAFNTRAVATDYELIRRLFGYPSWSLWGISYGTRIGLTLLRDYPAGIRAVVLDSVLPFEVDFFATIPENALRAMQALDAACDSGGCAADHGDFFETLAELVRRLDAEPIAIEVTRPVSGDTFPFRVDGPQLIDIVFTQLYSTRLLRALPRQISRIDFGGIDELVSGYVSRRDPEQLDLASGLYYTTWCREEFPFYDPALDDELLEELEPVFGDAFAEALGSDGFDRLCSIFEVDRSPPLDDAPVTSEVPTLIFAGAFDPITPPRWSRQVAAVLANAIYVELADHGHGMSSACPAAIRTAFLLDPSAPLDTTCAADTGPPDFE